MGCMNTGFPLIFTFSVLNYFASSLPVYRHAWRGSFAGSDSSSTSEELGSSSRADLYEDDPEYGPYFQGDMLNNPYERERNGIPGARFRWKKGIVNYIIDMDFSYEHTMLIYKALAEIEENTCIKFVEMVDNNDKIDNVVYRPHRSSCFAYVGRKGGTQYVNLANACFLVGHGKVVHETLHALGFYHEHCRTDRDSHIQLNLANVAMEDRSEFQIKPSDHYEVPYDYGSIMHYSEYAFAIDRTIRTIIPKVEGAKIGQREKISVSDSLRVNIMYGDECDSRYASETFESNLFQGQEWW